MQKAFPKITVGNQEKASHFMNANFFGPDIEKRIMANLLSGDAQSIRNAKHIFANAAQETSLFLMRREQAAIFYHGFFGKMLGQFGNFATSYVAFLTRAAHYGTPVQKAAFYSRWLATGAAFYFAANAIGLQGKDWLPWAPAQFTGGPLFHTMVNALNAIGSSYGARQARGELNSLLPVDLKKLYWKGKDAITGEESPQADGSIMQLPRRFPGYYQMKSAADINKYACRGDPVLAFYALISAPIRSDLR